MIDTPDFRTFTSLTGPATPAIGRATVAEVNRNGVPEWKRFRFSTPLPRRA